MSKRDEMIAAILAAADSNVGKVKAAFLAALNELRNGLVDEEALEAALASGNLDAALAATSIDDLENLFMGVGMNQNAYVFTDEIIRIFGVGAATALSNLPEQLQKALNFDMLNDRAVSFLRQEGAVMIKNIADSTRDGIKSVIERTLVDGVNPTKRAREVRQLIGLTVDQSTAVLNFRRQLETRQVLGLTPPDERRLNAIEQSMIRRHMKVGSFTDAQIDAMVERYYQSLLNKRALDIARTEALNAVNNGQLELWAQARDAGYLSDDEDRMFWITARDERVRATHAAIPGMNPYGVKIGSYFLTPFGLVRGPGDRNSNLINCRCVLVLGQVGDTIT